MNNQNANPTSAQIQANCRDCRGTGLYAGLGERDGIAVRCSRCRGTGQETIVYEPFQGLQKRAGVARVVQANPGVVINPEITQGGVTYEEWLENPASANAPGREVREHYCPSWWFQSADHARMPGWEECNIIQGSKSWSDCPLYANKDGCWERFDQDQARTETR